MYRQKSTPGVSPGAPGTKKKDKKMKTEIIIFKEPIKSKYEIENLIKKGWKIKESTITLIKEN